MVETCGDGEHRLYPFEPSTAAAAIYAVAFGILTVGHTFRMFQSRQWFMSILVVGSSFEVGGFAVRLTSINDPCTLGIYIVQYLLILLAPSIFSANIYMILGRTIRAVHGEALSPIRPTWLTKIFVTGDVLCFLIQMAGGGMLAGAEGDKKRADLGKFTILAGLFLQIVLFAVFIVVSYIFYNRLRKQPTPRSRQPEIRWLTMLYVLFGVSMLITVRNIFRVVEYAAGEDGYLLTNEWPMYVFDATLMLSVVAILLWWFPTLIRPRNAYMMDTLESQAPLTDRSQTGYKHVSSDFPSSLPPRHGY
ncbi:uncharacterized protein A1O9_03430 [Exophiala aquamarina CBS 119918]|uniref:RTA1 like protein n=1 Tax=Exophiala aquamarina CBS 119918 TaxID=1182545 RepID=A0A072PP48_9EURO|nr:uncharacterized protein A1O9_03430 [Exophiala aquamarina CBS 119918]KEF61859.1 hypothetical protein A1O9_03430 [Exophiala aquamarina CBS 119918]